MSEPDATNKLLIQGFKLLSQEMRLLSREMRKSCGYAARQELTELRDVIASRYGQNRLELFGHKVYSQNDEDGIIEELFRRLGIERGLFAEIGVEDGLQCNTHYLLHKGWRGQWIDGDAANEQQIVDKFGKVIGSGALDLQIARVTPRNIDTLVHGNPDFLCVDVDGMDIHLLAALGARPKVICIEYNAKFPPPLERVPVYDDDYEWKGTDYMGASLQSICMVANQKGYVLVGTNITGLNAFFVRDDLKTVVGFEESVIEHLYNPPRYWLTYDAFEQIGHSADFGAYEGDQ